MASFTVFMETRLNLVYRYIIIVYYFITSNHIIIMTMYQNILLFSLRIIIITLPSLYILLFQQATISDKIIMIIKRIRCKRRTKLYYPCSRIYYNISGLCQLKETIASLVICLFLSSILFYNSHYTLHNIFIL